ncbi:MAG: hypothetical protein ACOQNY_03050 [Mycoplasmoidaceae bacterium]
MKLKTILKISTPIAMVGVMTPIITSCGGNSFSFEYGENINCLKKEKGEGAIPYHSIKSVANAARKHADRCTISPISVTTINNNLETSDKNFKNCYFDLIASITILGTYDSSNPTPIKITDWSDNLGSHTFSFKLWWNDVELKNIEVTNDSIYYYAPAIGDHISIVVPNSGGADIMFPSYTYQDCVASEI